MTKRHAALLSFLFLLGFALPAPPAFAQAVGTACSKQELGVSKLSTDQKNVIACLLKDTGAGYEWKAYTSASGMESGSFCGVFPYHSVTYKMGDCNPNKIVFNPAGVIPCMGAAANTCPAGYTRKALVDYVKSESDGCGGTSDYGFKIYTCVKN